MHGVRLIPCWSPPRPWGVLLHVLYGTLQPSPLSAPPPRPLPQPASAFSTPSRSPTPSSHHPPLCHDSCMTHARTHRHAHARTHRHKHKHTCTRVCVCPCARAGNELCELLQSADLNADGFIDWREFVAATYNLSMLERDESLYKAFRCDTARVAQGGQDGARASHHFLAAVGTCRPCVVKMRGDERACGPQRVEYWPARQHAPCLWKICLAYLRGQSVVASHATGKTKIPMQSSSTKNAMPCGNLCRLPSARARRHFDRNADGFITRDELEAALSGMPHGHGASILALMAEADSNGDGKVDYR